MDTDETSVTEPTIESRAAQKQRVALIELALRLMHNDAAPAKKKLASLLRELELDVPGLMAASVQLSAAWRHRNRRETKLRTKYLTQM